MPPEPNWRDSLPDDLKGHTTLRDVKDVASLAQQFVNAQSLLGTSIRIPGPDASTEARQEFLSKLMGKVPELIPTPDPNDTVAMDALYTKMGRPKEVSGYKVPDGVDAAKVGDFAKVAFEQGLTQKQFEALLSSAHVANQTRQQASEQEHLTALRGLKQEWGIVYEDNLQLVQSVMKGTGAPKEFLELAADNKLPAGTLKWLYNIGKQLGTEGINFHKDEGQTTRLSPAEAQAQVNEIMNNKESPYWKASHPQHKEYVKRVVDLRRAMAAGGLT